MIYQILFYAVIIFVVLLLVFARQLLLWLSAKTNGISVSLIKIIRIKFSSVSTDDLIRGLILCKKANINLTLDELYNAAIAGANIQNIVLGMVAADQAGMHIQLNKAIELDKRDINIFQYVKSGGKS